MNCPEKYIDFKFNLITDSESSLNQTVAEVEGKDEVVKALLCHALFSDNIS